MEQQEANTRLSIVDSYWLQEVCQVQQGYPRVYIDHKRVQKLIAQRRVWDREGAF